MSWLLRAMPRRRARIVPELPQLRLVFVAFALALLCSTLVIGQQRGAPAPANPALPAQPGPGPRGGGGRGRGAAQVMTLTSSAWPDGGQIPAQYTQEGDDMSPPLAWSGAPASVASYVLIVHDVDASIGNGTDDLLHWLVWNIPATVTSLHERAPALSQLMDGTRQISATGPYYRGPGAPAAGPQHHYLFDLFALDTMLEVPAVGASPPATRAAVVVAMAGHVRGKASSVGLFKRR
ncbi:MAG: YbhB/YbcL family Raf kinase inhibitor-like protein [Vicinamibacterales bacterium]